MAETNKQKLDRVQKQVYWQEHIERWSESTLSVSRYCQEHVLSLSQFKYWQERLTKIQSPLFVEVGTRSYQAYNSPFSERKLMIETSNGMKITLQTHDFYRRRFAIPILVILHRWLKQQQKTAPPKTPLGLAIQYSLNHWKALKHYLLDGELDIDNNRAEPAIKPFVIGRKNFLFAGSHRGAEHAAVIYSLIESCKMLNINTFDYCKDVLLRLPNTLNKNISELFPCFWRPLA